MYLRYGSEEPNIEKPPAPLLSLRFIAKLMKLSYSRVNYLVTMYFNADKEVQRQSLFVPKYRPKPKGRSLVTEANLTVEEFSFLTDPENLKS